ncbi:DUF6612 family protein [Streptococcus pacificus]|uniref:Lipoprotein n=1 Tax=Streptococcus pacificus TaxID=2740577 RepID=A0ABS0ZIF5_9STRE|nr:DUF6612 family protein [Streptococcus pacificus]MBJ8325785.1 hypothetical protein [Streptococcus pacificus]
MKKHSFFSLVLIFGVLFLLVGCQANTDSNNNDNNQTETTKVSKEITVDDFLEEMQTKNEDLSSVKGEHQFKVSVNDNISSQKIDSQLIFDDSKLTKGDIVFNTESQDGKKLKEKFIYNSQEDPDVYREVESDGNTTKEYNSTKGNEFYFHPDYFEVLEIISSLKDDLQIKDKGDVYELSLKNKDVSLISAFEEQYNLSLTGVEEDETEKSLVITFDKDTYFCKEFRLVMTYDGKKGSLEMNVASEYSKWNEIDEDSIKIPEQ